MTAPEPGLSAASASREGGQCQVVNILNLSYPKGVGALMPGMIRKG